MDAGLLIKDVGMDCAREGHIKGEWLASTEQSVQGATAGARACRSHLHAQSSCRGSLPTPLRPHRLPAPCGACTLDPRSLTLADIESADISQHFNTSYEFIEEARAKKQGGGLKEGTGRAPPLLY